MSNNPMNFSLLINRRCIDLSFNGLHDGNIDVLIDVICKTKVLHSLNLWGNRLSLDDVTKKETETETETESESESETETEKCNLADAIARNTTIRVLSLGGNDISASGGKRLADALRVNATIIELHLGDNRLGDEGASHIASALGSSTNIAISTLGLYGNGITDVGAGCLASAFRSNVGLRHLWLHANRIGDRGYDAIVNAIRYNRRIESVLLLSERHDGEIRAILDARTVEIEGKEEEGVVTHVEETKEEDEATATAEAVNVEVSSPSSTVRDNYNDEHMIALSAKDEEIANLRAALHARDAEIEAKDEEIAALLQCIAEGWKGALTTRAAAALVLEEIKPSTTTTTTTTTTTRHVNDAVVSNSSMVKKNAFDVPSYDDDVRDEIDDIGHDADEDLSLHPALSVE